MKCLWCGKESGSKRFCHWKHGRKYKGIEKKANEIKKEKRCQNPECHRIYASSDNRKKYCSGKCRNRIRVLWQNSRKKHKVLKSKKKCRVCKEPIPKNRRPDSFARSKYCSDKCKVRAFRERLAKKQKNMEKKFKLLPPMMPNFISYEVPIRKKQDGLSFDNKIPVGELSEDEAKEYADLMKETFLNHWAAKSHAQQQT